MQNENYKKQIEDLNNNFNKKFENLQKENHELIQKKENILNLEINRRNELCNKYELEISNLKKKLVESENNYLTEMNNKEKEAELRKLDENPNENERIEIEKLNNEINSLKKENEILLNRQNQSISNLNHTNSIPLDLLQKFIPNPTVESALRFLTHLDDVNINLSTRETILQEREISFEKKDEDIRQRELFLMETEKRIEKEKMDLRSVEHKLNTREQVIRDCETDIKLRNMEAERYKLEIDEQIKAEWNNLNVRAKQLTDIDNQQKQLTSKLEADLMTITLERQKMYDQETKISRLLNQLSAKEMEFKNLYGEKSILPSSSIINLDQEVKSSLVMEQPNLSKENKTIFNIINDFSFLKILVEPFFLYNAEKPFDFDIFYKDFFETLYADNEEYLTMVSQDISKRLDQLVTKIHQKEVKKRSLFKIPFHISDDLTIGVEGFNIISEQKKSSYVWIDDQSGKVADLSTTWVCHDTTQPLFPSDFKYSYIYGGKLVVFTKDELFKIRNFGKPGLTLLGFKPLSKLKFQYNIKHPYFIYPDENQYIGSYSVFAHLLDTMAKMEKMAICNFIPRSNSSPRLVALLPQTEERDENDIQIIPPGFNVIPLPFADDIRTVKNNACERASEELDIEFGKIIKGINNKEGYNPRTINNPYLQKFYLNLQTIALNRDEIEDIKDDTIFQYEVSDKVNELIQSIGSQLSIRSETPKEVKRKNTDNSQSQRKKQCNEKTGIANVTSADSLKSYTVAELKEYLTSVNIKPTKKKADLIDQVVAYLKL
jgi:ATP-dependent DNA helicase 2 subunit 1